jgi:sporulation protein YlmC with PRC-barrel domain
MINDNIRLRTELVNTQVIALNTGKKLGVVKELLVDVDRRDIVALGLRDNILSLSGMPKYMYLNSIRQTGDVILVDNEDVLIDIDMDAYTRLINSEVVTETGEPLGRVRDFQFNLEDGKITSIIIASLGYPQIPDQIISTYELPIEEVVSSGPNRLIVFEGAQEHLNQLTVGILERLGIGKPVWEREEEQAYYPPTIPIEKQLPTGVPVRPPISTPVEGRTTILEERWDDDEWRQETRTAPSSPSRQKAETVRYEEYEDDDLEKYSWNEAKNQRPLEARFEPQPYEPPKRREKEYSYDYDEDVNNDVWDDDVNSESPSYNPPLNIPEKKKAKAPEYEEEPG